MPLPGVIQESEREAEMTADVIKASKRSIPTCCTHLSLRSFSCRQAFDTSSARSTAPPQRSRCACSSCSRFSPFDPVAQTAP